MPSAPPSGRSLQEAAVHLAWYAEPGRYLDDVGENLRALRSTTMLLEALVEVHCRRVVLAGTGLETLPPATIYTAAKAAAHLVATRLRDDGLVATCAHVFYLYGRGEDPRRVVPTVIRALLRAESVAVGDGSEVRDYVHVQDVAAAFCTLVETDAGPSVDICSGRTVRLRDVFDVIGRETGRSDLIRHGERTGTSATFPATGDPSPLRALGWVPTIDLDDGIRDAIRYWQAELSGSDRPADGQPLGDGDPPT